MIIISDRENRESSAIEVTGHIIMAGDRWRRWPSCMMSGHMAGVAGLLAGIMAAPRSTV